MIANKEMDDIIKIFKSLEESGLLIKGVIKRTKRWISWYVNRYIRFIGKFVSRQT